MSSALTLARDFVAEHEGLALKPYRCPAGVLTIGYGHTGPAAQQGKAITKEYARELLLADLALAETACASLVKGWRGLTSGQQVALISFVFNVGKGAFAQSTLLRELNNGNHVVVPEQLMRWSKVNGSVLLGLFRRRYEEAVLWLT